MLTPARKVPNEPGVHGAENELALFRPGPRALHVIQYPAYLGAGEIGVYEQAGLVAYIGADALRRQLVAEGRRPPALPHDGVIDRFACCAVPNDAGLALVRDADGRDVLRRDAALFKGLGQGLYLRAEDVRRVVLDPAGTRVYLRVVVLGQGDDLAPPVEHDSPGTGRTLVKGNDVAFHLKPPLVDLVAELY